MKIERAILSVSDKTGIVDFATFLRNRGVEILSTGGTAAELRKAGISVKDISEHTGFPEIMDGRVKTLHPKVHGGILNIRDKAEHKKDKESLGISDIDLVVVNLYPFKETISKPGVTFEEAIENIDIGGPSMIRAAAKNFRHVTVIIDPKDYSKVMGNIDENNGKTSKEMRFYLAKKVFFSTMGYDRMIYEYLAANIPFGR